MRYVYGVFWQIPAKDAITPNHRDQWALTENKRVALRHARKTHGIVGRITRLTHSEGGNFGWDAPTFRAVMDVIADYTKE